MMDENVNDFEKILSKPMSEVERPKPVPVGTYLVGVIGLPEYGESERKKTPRARYTLEILEPQQDVDPVAVEERGGVVGSTIRHDVWLTDNNMWRAREFVENCGISIGQMGIGEALESVNGAQLLVLIRHEPAQDGSDQLYARIAKTMPIA
jgi:hypothetical protein